MTALAVSWVIMSGGALGRSQEAEQFRQEDEVLRKNVEVGLARGPGPPRWVSAVRVVWTSSSCFSASQVTWGRNLSLARMQTGYLLVLAMACLSQACVMILVTTTTR